jgi:hypothetical protein
MHLEVLWLLMLYHKLNMCYFRLLIATLTSLKAQDRCIFCFKMLEQVTCAFSQLRKNYASL